MNTILQDLRYALRQLRRAPAFALTAILTLALGIGASTAVFSVIDATLLRPLPFAHQDRLVAIETRSQSGYQQPSSYLDYQDMRQQLSTFTAFAGYFPGKLNLDTGGEPASLRVIKGTDNFFDIFGVKPLLGRTFLPGEDQTGKDSIAVLSYELWQSRFAGNKAVVGTTIRLDGEPYTIIGIMPYGFRFPLSYVNALYTPLHPNKEWKNSRGSHWLPLIGLVKPGITRQQATADINRTLGNLARAYPDTGQGRTGRALSLAQDIIGKTSAPLWTLAFAVLALLSIACVNVASLLLARGVQREREIALRAAIGAARSRLIRQLITESFTLSAAGMLLGIALAYFMIFAMRTFLLSALARGADVRVNLPALFAAVVLALLTSIAAGLAPALRLSRTDPGIALRSGPRSGTGMSQNRLRSAFIVTQVALSLVLLVVSGLLLRSLENFLSTDLGFAPDRILAIDLDLSAGRYEGRDPLVSFYQPLLERIAQIHGVQGAGIVNLLPIREYGSNSDAHIAGQPPYPKNQEMLAELRIVSAGYFNAMGAKLLAGRQLSASLDKDEANYANVIVNQAFQRKFYPNGGNPVGGADDSGNMNGRNNFVGMVTNLRQDVLEPPMAEMDVLAEELSPKTRAISLISMRLVIRTNGDPRALVAPVTAAIHSIDPTVPVTSPETMRDVLRETLIFERMQSWLFGIFAALAVLLAMAGLYGLVSHEVELGTRDIGVRMALGSTRGGILAGVLRRVALLTALGTALGIVLTLAARQIFRSVVELHATHDAPLIAVLGLAMILLGLAAALLPARRAANLDPNEALRSE